MPSIGESRKGVRDSLGPVAKMVRWLEGSAMDEPPDKCGSGGKPCDFSRQASLLSMTLQVAVPLWFCELRELEDRMPADEFWEEVQRRAKECSDSVGEHGDALMFRVRDKSAEAFNRLAEGIALMAFCPGGVTAFGTHWECKAERKELR